MINSTSMRMQIFWTLVSLGLLDLRYAEQLWCVEVVGVVMLDTSLISSLTTPLFMIFLCCSSSATLPSSSPTLSLVSASVILLQWSTMTSTTPTLSLVTWHVSVVSTPVTTLHCSQSFSVVRVMADQWPQTSVMMTPVLEFTVTTLVTSLHFRNSLSSPATTSQEVNIVNISILWRQLPSLCVNSFFSL